MLALFSCSQEVDRVLPSTSNASTTAYGNQEAPCHTVCRFHCWLLTPRLSFRRDR